MRYRVTIKAGDDDLGGMPVSDRDIPTDVATLLRTAYQHYRDVNGRLVDPPTMTITVEPIQEGEVR